MRGQQTPLTRFGPVLHMVQHAPFKNLFSVYRRFSFCPRWSSQRPKLFLFEWLCRAVPLIFVQKIWGQIEQQLQRSAATRTTRATSQLFFAPISKRKTGVSILMCSVYNIDTFGYYYKLSSCSYLSRKQKVHLKGSVQANLGICLFCLETYEDVLAKAVPKSQRK